MCASCVSRERAARNAALRLFTAMLPLYGGVPCELRGVESVTMYTGVGGRNGQGWESCETSGRTRLLPGAPYCLVELILVQRNKIILHLLQVFN